MNLRWLHHYRLQAAILAVVFLFTLWFYFPLLKEIRIKRFQPYDPELFAKIKGSVFEGFDNEKGSADGELIVPNYVHFIFFEKSNIDYVTAVCILAAFKHQQPEKIFLHTNVGEFTGTHWPRIRDTLGAVLEIRKIEMPTEIFGQKFREEWIPWHAGDVTKIRILMEYGGVFLDNDSYIVRSLDVFRKYEMTIGLTEPGFMGTQVLIANKDARMLRLWLETYRDYHPDEWYMNAGEKPMVEILRYRPDLVHTVKKLLGVHTIGDRIYNKVGWTGWRGFYTMHLVARFCKQEVSMWEYFKRPKLDEKNICDYDKPFGDMAREVYSDFCE